MRKLQRRSQSRKETVSPVRPLRRLEPHSELLSLNNIGRVIQINQDQSDHGHFGKQAAVSVHIHISVVQGISVWALQSPLCYRESRLSRLCGL
jgi:hypothetical protein